MAKAPKSAKIVNVDFLKTFLAAPNGVVYVTQAEAVPFMPPTSDPALIEVNTTMLDPNDPSKAAARLSEAGKAMVNGAVAAVSEAKPTFGIITGAALPPSKRGNRGGGAKAIYPFDSLEVGQSFFVPVSAKYPDPAKKLGSTVSAQNAKYAVETGETKQVERTKRGAGNRAVLDAAGNKVKETVTVKATKLTRKFSIRPVKEGETYGTWVAPGDGALIARVELAD
jgi:hypothetical protein